MTDTQIDQKKRVGEKAADWVQDNMIIGLGTGSTAYHFIIKLAQKIKEENLTIKALTSSEATKKLADDLHIPQISLDECDLIDLYVDGADEIDPEMNLIKGRGGAMVQEKILAANSKEFIVIADESKMVNRLCSKFPVPVETLPLAKATVKKGLQELGGVPDLRMDKNTSSPITTDQGNFIYDTTFSPDQNTHSLDVQINQLPGVLGHGIFIGLATKVITTQDGRLRIID